MPPQRLAAWSEGSRSRAGPAIVSGGITRAFSAPAARLRSAGTSGPSALDRLVVGDAGEAARARVRGVHYAATLAFVVFFFDFIDEARGIWE